MEAVGFQFLKLQGALLQLASNLFKSFFCSLCTTGSNSNGFPLVSACQLLPQIQAIQCDAELLHSSYNDRSKLSNVYVGNFNHTTHVFSDDPDAVSYGWDCKGSRVVCLQLVGRTKQAWNAPHSGKISVWRDTCFNVLFASPLVCYPSPCQQQTLQSACWQRYQRIHWMAIIAIGGILQTWLLGLCTMLAQQSLSCQPRGQPSDFWQLQFCMVGSSSSQLLVVGTLIL